MRKIRNLFIVLVFFFGFGISHASGLTQAQIESILNMLRAFGADSVTVSKVQATLSGTASPYSGSGSGNTENNYNNGNDYSNSPGVQTSFCPNLYRNLYKGISGEDVRELQRFLKESGDYKYPEITGYYGTVTENAVKNFQARVGVVSYGSPASTGFGVVGPATRAAIKKACGADKIAKSFILTPNAGSVPFISAAVFSYKGSNCTSFTLDWGDGSEPIVQYAQSDNCDSYTVQKTAKHTYVKEGDFTVRLTISREGKTESYSKKVHSGTPFARHFDINPTQGEAPLLVGMSFAIPDNNCSAYKVSWGDGNVDSKEATEENCDDSSVRMQSLTHSYQNPGDYTLVLHMGQSKDLDSLPVVEQRIINVKGSDSSDSAGRQYVITVRPTSGSAPLVTRVQLKGTAEACTSYEIDWGDGTAKQLHTADSSDNCSGNFVKDFVHTYFIPGTYTLKVRAAQGSLTDVPYEYQYISVSN